MNEYDVYTADELYAIMFDPRQTISTSQWRNFFRSRTIFSEQEYIRFDTIEASRKIAPFMHANVPGRPIYREDGSEIKFFRPAYTKPKDAVTPGEFMAMTGPEAVRRIPLQTPQARMAQKIINITRFHRQAIERLWDYLHAKSLMDGMVTITYMTDDGLVGESVVVNYDRDAAHTVDASGGADSDKWSDDTFDIWGDIQDQVDVVSNAKFGGPVDTMLLGASAAKQFLKFMNTEGKGRERLRNDIRGAEDVLVNRGIVRTDPLNPFTFLGRLDNNLDVFKVSGMGNQFQNDDGSYAGIVNEWDMVLVAPSVEMIMAFGAIMDVNNFRAQDIFVKMFDEQDPSARFILSQSAPLPIVVNPNATLKKRVA